MTEQRKSMLDFPLPTDEQIAFHSAEYDRRLREQKEKLKKAREEDPRK